MKKRILILNTGFIKKDYLQNLIDTCVANGIDYKVLEKDEYSPAAAEQFDFVISDCNFIQGVCNVFHAHTVLQKLKTLKFLPLRIYYYFSHLKSIRKTCENYTNSGEKSRWVCVSDTLKRDFVENYNILPERVIVAYPGFYQTVNNDDKEFAEYDYNRPFVVGMDARGFVNKGGYFLLGALRRFRRRNPEAKILAKFIYPKYKTNLALRLYVKLFRLENMVEFLGVQSDMDKFYDGIDCFISTSILESFGRVVVEAMYAKKPVIAGSNVGASEIIAKNNSGFVFSARENTAANLAEKIEEVYKSYNTLKPVVDRAYEQSKSFTWDNFCSAVIQGLYGTNK